MSRKTRHDTIHDLFVKIFLDPFIRPANKFMRRRETARRIKLYNPASTLYGLNTEKRDYELTVSFTTYPARIGVAVYVADAMLRQTLKPDRVILALASDEFESKADLPGDYEQLEKRGLTVVFTENLKPHKKYRYAMMNYPDSLIVTVDDDLLYPENLLEMLVNSYTRYPDAISTRRAHRMLFENGKLLPYRKWVFESEYTDKPAFDLISTNGAGALYPPGCLSACGDLLFDSDAVKKNALSADDIWLKFIALKCGVPVVIADKKTQTQLVVPGSQNTALYDTNVGEMHNDIVIRNCMVLMNWDDETLQSLLVRKTVSYKDEPD